MKHHLALTLLILATPALAGDPGDPGAAIQRYYAAIDRGDFHAAFAAWAPDGGTPRLSYADFAKGFAQTGSTQVQTGSPINPEGAAGSSYIDVPVDVTATLKDGRRQHFTGRYTLRAVNDVPGSSAASRRWHIFSAELKPAP